MNTAPGASAPRARRAVDRVVAVIDTSAPPPAGLPAVVVPLAIAVAYEVVTLYVFNAPTRWASTLTHVLYGS